MEPTDWPAVHRIYADGIATGDATLEREAPDWDHFDRSHRNDCRLVARLEQGGLAVGWVALTAYSSRVHRRRLGECLRRRGASWPRHRARVAPSARPRVGASRVLDAPRGRDGR